MCFPATIDLDALACLVVVALFTAALVSIAFHSPPHLERVVFFTSIKLLFSKVDRYYIGFSLSQGLIGSQRNEEGRKN